MGGRALTQWHMLCYSCSGHLCAVATLTFILSTTHARVWAHHSVSWEGDADGRQTPRRSGDKKGCGQPVTCGQSVTCVWDITRTHLSKRNS